MNVVAKVRQMSTGDLAVLGLQAVAYVKPVVVKGKAGFAIHAADGSALATAATRELAFATIRQNDLEPVSVH